MRNKELTWNSLTRLFVFFQVNKNQNDGEVLLQELALCHTDYDLLRVLSKVYGPWSLIYLQVIQSLLVIHCVCQDFMDIQAVVYCIKYACVKYCDNTCTVGTLYTRTCKPS